LLNSFGPRTKQDGTQVKRITFVIGKNGRLKLAYWYDGRGDVTDHVQHALAAVKS
jgi:peroxiredoxin